MSLLARVRGPAANLALSAAAVVVVAGGAEGVARLLERERSRPPVEDYIWDWQQRWEGEFYTMRSEATGWPPWEEINADGLRDRTHAVEKPEGVLRLVFLGDSVTLGAEIAPAEAYPQLVQRHLDERGAPVEVFNVALWGWSTRQERLAYQRIARKYGPDLVVLAVCLNDVPELQNNLSRPPRWLSLLHERSALVRRVVDAPGREIRSVEQLFEAPEAETVRAGFAKFFVEVRALRAEVLSDGAAFALAVFPFRFQVLPGAPAPAAQETIAAFCQAEGLRCLDLLPALRPAGAEAFVDYDHLSPRGSRLVAEELLRSGLVPGRPAPPAVARAEQDPRGAVPALVALLRDPAELVRMAAARALGRRGAEARAAVEPLFAALADPRAGVRAEAARALAALGLQAEADLPSLVAALDSGDAYVRSFAAWSLGNMGEAARAAVPALARALSRDEGYGRGGAAAALARMGPAAAEAVPALVRGLQDADGERRWKAARTLGRIGPLAAEAVPALVRALQDPHELVRRHAARALGRVGAGRAEAAAALERARGDGDEEVRREAAEALTALRSE